MGAFKMRRSLLVIGTAIGALLASTSASAATFVVSSVTNSVGGGTGLATGLQVTAGQGIQISAPSTALWSAGTLPRWSNADGLVANLLATGTDASGQTAGTLIGQAIAPLTQNGFTAPYGALVGQIGSTYQLLGTNVGTTAWGTGELLLYYWDANNNDNRGSITVAATVPEPATWALMMAGFGILGFGLRRRNSTDSRVSFKFA